MFDFNFDVARLGTQRTNNESKRNELIITASSTWNIVTENLSHIRKQRPVSWVQLSWAGNCRLAQCSPCILIAYRIMENSMEAVKWKWKIVRINIISVSRRVLIASRYLHCPLSCATSHKLQGCSSCTSIEPVVGQRSPRPSNNFQNVNAYRPTVCAAVPFSLLARPLAFYHWLAVRHYRCCIACVYRTFCRNRSIWRSRSALLSAISCELHWWQCSHASRHWHLYSLYLPSHSHRRSITSSLLTFAWWALLSGNKQFSFWQRWVFASEFWDHWKRRFIILIWVLRSDGTAVRKSVFCDYIHCVGIWIHWNIQRFYKHWIADDNALMPPFIESTYRNQTTPVKMWMVRSIFFPMKPKWFSSSTEWKPEVGVWHACKSISCIDYSHRGMYARARSEYVSEYIFFIKMPAVLCIFIMKFFSWKTYCFPNSININKYVLLASTIIIFIQWANSVSPKPTPPNFAQVCCISTSVRFPSISIAILTIDMRIEFQQYDFTWWCALFYRFLWSSGRSRLMRAKCISRIFTAKIININQYYPVSRSQ